MRQVSSCAMSPYIAFLILFHVFQGCSKNFTGGQGTISSPGFPNAYPSNSDCVSRIHTSPGTRVVVSFLGISIENSSGCSKDYIEVSTESSLD